MADNGAKYQPVYPKAKKTSSNVLFCQKTKYIQITVIKEKINQKTFTFKLLKSENLLKPTIRRVCLFTTPGTSGWHGRSKYLEKEKVQIKSLNLCKLSMNTPRDVCKCYFRVSELSKQHLRCVHSLSTTSLIITFN